MAIQNFPASLQPIIQQGFLERDFQDSLRSKLGFRMIADRMEIPNGVGETVTKTRPGLKPSATTPLTPSTNTNLDNGLTPAGWPVEQYTVSINQYGATTDLNMVTNRVGIVGQFMQNNVANAEQAARTLDDLCRNALFGGAALSSGVQTGGYLGGNTRVRVTLGSANATISVDDVRGFQLAYVNGVATAVSGGATLSVTVGSTVYTLSGVTPDGSNVSTAPNGISGTLTFTTTVSTADGTAGNAVISAIGQLIVRPSGRATTAAIQATDTLTIQNLLDAKARLEINAVPTVDGFYHAYLDPISMRQLFADPDWKQLFQGATTENATYRNGVAQNPLLGLRFIRTTEAFVQAHPSLANTYVRRPIVCGAGALIEGDFQGVAETDVVRSLGEVTMVDDVAMVIREPIDRLQQIIAQSWYWIGGFAVPTDITTNSTTVGTATNAAFKRAVVIEHVG